MASYCMAIDSATARLASLDEPLRSLSRTIWPSPLFTHEGWPMDATTGRLLCLCVTALVVGCGGSASPSAPSISSTSTAASTTFTPAPPAQTSVPTTPGSGATGSATLSGLKTTVTAQGGQCGAATDGSGGFAVLFHPSRNSAAGGGVLSFGVTVKSFGGAGDYALATAGPNYGILQLDSGVKLATSGVATVASDQKSGSIKASFDGGIHMDATFTC